MEHNEQLAALQDIRAIMERSSRFMSLSGIGGILVGLTGMVGAVIAYFYLGKDFSIRYDSPYLSLGYLNWGLNLREFFLLWASSVLSLAIGLTLLFTYWRSKRKKYKVWDATAARSMINFAVPATTGGLICINFLWRGFITLLAPITLIFFGLACVNVSKYTLEEVRYMGYAEIVLGLAALFAPSLGLLLWGIGFGVVILIFGLYLYRRYERFD
jgi:predicted lysophospholipase L1 biosynthesis ABC-type transport system permease subunit